MSDNEVLTSGSIWLITLFTIVGILSSIIIRALPSSHQLYPKWVGVWLIISSIIVTWDASFILNRPYSFTAPLWKPYADYIKVDKLYADTNDSFVVGQSYMNLIEATLNLISIYFFINKKYKTASVIGLITSTMTCSKTVLYHVMEFASGFSKTSQNQNLTMFLLYIIPNGVWIWIPLAVMIQLSYSIIFEKENIQAKNK